MNTEVLAIAYRGDLPESCHYGSIAVVDKSGKVLYSRGDPDRMTFLRSAAKPFQLLPLFETGTAANFGFSLDEIAVMTASHSGEDIHVGRLNSILSKTGLSENNLQCGMHPPLHRPTAQRMLMNREPLTPLRNTCSGKHLCMLSIAKYKGWDLNTYMELRHPIQQLMLNTISEMTGYPAERIITGIDTCGVPVFAMPLKHIALGYANLSVATEYPDFRREGIETIRKAMFKFPELIAGSGRFTTELLKTAEGRFVAKDGAESLFGIGVISEGIGIAVKIEDGSERALSAVVMEILMELNLLDENALNKLNLYRTKIIKTYSGVAAGRIEPVKLI